MTVLLTVKFLLGKIPDMSKNMPVNSVNPNGMPAVFPQGPRPEGLTLPTVSKKQKTKSSAAADPIYSLKKSNSSEELDFNAKDFKDLLMVMMLSSVISSMNSSNNNSLLGQSGDLGGINALSSMGGSAGGMLSPAIMGLFNNILGSETQTPLQMQSNSYANPDVPHMKPTTEGHLTQEFSEDHIGVDTGMNVGTPIHATMNGKVTYAGWNNEGYGNLVIVQNGKYTTYFAHLSDVPVEVGQSVTSGQVIGYSGSTGNSTGPHLHYEVRVENYAVDPMKFYGNSVNHGA